jgi:chemotaxis methyl-accepting protein methylase/mannose-6-phosphate isomerase-like protein (cupin superfamily)
MPYLYELPPSVSFRGKGLFGYSFGPMQQKDVEVLYVESETGHDTFLICRGVVRTYYILAGSGHFTIDGRAYNVGPGILVEVPSGVEYSYSGRITMLVFCKQSWFHRNDKWTRWNRDVVGSEDPWSLTPASWLTRLVRMRIFSKSPTRAFLRLGERLWNILPASFRTTRPLRWYGHFVHALATIEHVRAQAFNTYFLRNRAQLELIRRLVNKKRSGDTVRVAVLGCSTGPEAYSIAWAIKTARPDLRLILQAADISKEAVEFAERGVYPLNAGVGDKQIYDCMAAGRWRICEPGSELVGSEIFERMTPDERADFFDFYEDVAVVRNWIKGGINWHVEDAKDPRIVESLGLQDIVVASNFLCHMEDSEAERCLRNIARLVGPRGYLFVTGIAVNVRAKVARELRWEPVTDLFDEIHDGDISLRGQWPYHYSGLEPLNKKRQDWRIRYAAAFQLDSAPPLPYPRDERILSRNRNETLSERLNG